MRNFLTNVKQAVTAHIATEGPVLNSENRGWKMICLTDVAEVYECCGKGL